MRVFELGHVVLYVTNLSKVAGFYRDILGFAEVTRDRGSAMFSSGRTHHELLLIEIGGAAPEGPRRVAPGLYHIGFKVGNTDDELRAAYRDLLVAGVQIVGSADHGVTHSLYILDPDGNELELYVDVSDAWKLDPKAVAAPVRALPRDFFGQD